MSAAIALDIDGVLLRGGKVIPGAVKAVQQLVASRLPFVFVTNGGGMLEKQKAKDLSKKLEMEVASSQVILCHTPFRSLASQYGDKPVLVVGRESCLQVATSYGFKHIVTPQHLYDTCPDVLPIRKPNHDHCNSHEDLRKSIQAALIFHDPTDWTLDMQVLSDVLMPEVGSKTQRIPVYASNADIVYATEYPYPRFTQGAFVEAFRHLFQLHHQLPLQLTYYGKPYKIQYEFAEEMLSLQAQQLNLPPPKYYFGIGDNPKSDIRGANNAGDDWQSVLVRTGLFQGEHHNDPHDPANHVFHNVAEAVEYILAEHK